MPDEPIREQVLAAVALKLASITAGPVYWATPALVTRSLLPVTQYKAELELGPVFGVTRGSGSMMERIAHPTAPGEAGTYHQHFRFNVEAYVQMRDDIIAATWLFRAWEDHRIALMADVTLGGLVLDLEMQEDATDNGGAEPKAWFGQAWVAHWVRDY